MATFSTEIEEQIKRVLLQLSKVNAINPAIFLNFRNDFEKLDKIVNDNATNFVATSDDLNDFRKSLNRVKKALTKAQSVPATTATTIKINNLTNNILAMQKQFATNLANNNANISQNNALYTSQQNAIQQNVISTKQATKIQDMYAKKLQAYMAQYDFISDRLSHIVDSFSKNEIKDMMTAGGKEYGAKTHNQQARSIRTSLLNDIPKNLLASKITNSTNIDPDETLFDNKDKVSTLSNIRKYTKSKDNLEDISKARGSNSLWYRFYKSMEIESKSPKSKLIAVNLFRNSFINPIKFALSATAKTFKQIVQNTLIGILNAPFKLLGFLFTKISDLFTLTFKGKDALRDKKENRNNKKALDEFEKTEEFNDKLGIGLEKLASILDKHLALISTPSLNDISYQYNQNKLNKLGPAPVNPTQAQLNWPAGWGTWATTANPVNQAQHTTNPINPVNQTQHTTSPINPINTGQATAQTSSVTNANPSKNVMSRAWEIARGGASTHGGKASDYFKESLIQAYKEQQNASTVTPQTQVQEQNADNIIKNEDEQTELLREISNKLDNTEKDGTKKKGLFDTIKAMLAKAFGGIFGSVSGFGGKLLAAMGLTKLFSKTGVLAKYALRAAPLAAAIYSIFNAIKETEKEFIDQGNAVDNALERFRLLTQNFVTSIPGLIDNIFGTDIKGAFDRGFKSLNEFGSMLGSKLYDIFEGLKEFITNPASILNNKEAGDKVANITKTIAKIGKDGIDIARGAELERTEKKKKDKEFAKLPVRITSTTGGKHDKNSKHYTGNAVDLTPKKFGSMPYTGIPLKDENPEAFEAYNKTSQMLKSMGYNVIDEYSQANPTSKHGSARHIHVEGSTDQITELVNRAAVVKGGVVQSAKPTKTTPPKKEKPNNEVPKGVPVVVNVPAPVVSVSPSKVIIDRDMDSSFNGYMYLHRMNA